MPLPMVAPPVLEEAPICLGNGTDRVWRGAGAKAEREIWVGEWHRRMECLDTPSKSRFAL